MKEVISFNIPGNPKALKRHRSFQKGNFKGTYDPSKNDKADFLAMALNHKPTTPYDEPLYVSLVFNFPRPKSHYRTGKYSGILKPSAPNYHTSTPDADNLAKFVCDALNGIFWKDDSRICMLDIAKKYEESPSVDVSILTIID